MTAAGLAWPLDFPLYLGGSNINTEVGTRWDCAINGVGYMLDLNPGLYRDYFRALSAQVTRTQSDSSDSPGQQSLNRDELWRRSFTSWHMGANQRFFDMDSTGQPFQFWASKGVDPWTRNRLTLLNTTSMVRSTTNANTQVVTGNGVMWVVDGSTVYRSTDGATFAALTGSSGNLIAGITTDGAYVYVSDGLNVYQILAGSTAYPAAYNALRTTMLWYGMGRLMAAGYGSTAGSIYNITSTSTPSALFTHPNPQWTWTAFAEGQSVIYAAGYAGDRSTIYRIPLKSDGTGLDQPIPAGSMPTGEVVYAMTGYAGFLVIATSKGVRLAQLSDDLSIGPYLPIGPVYALEGQSRFVWFGWSSYDPTTTGLGRLDLTTFTDTSLVPAYASDLMAANTTGTVKSIVTFAGRRFFTVQGSGLWAEGTTPLSSGTLDSSWVTYGLADLKVLDSIFVRTEPLVGSVDVSISTDDVTYQLVGSHNVTTQQRTTVTTTEIIGDKHRLRFTLNSASSTSPILTNITLFTLPIPLRGREWHVPLLMGQMVADRSGQHNYVSPVAELERFDSIMQTPPVFVPFQLGVNTYRVYVDSYGFDYSEVTPDQSTAVDLQGTLTVILKKPARGY